MFSSRGRLIRTVKIHRCLFRAGMYSRRLACLRLLNTKPDGVDKIEKFILENTEVTRDHLTPEIALHLITPKCHLWYSSEVCEVDDPFWAFYWPGGQGLTRFILDNGSIVAGQSVLDIGSGCGSSAIAALMKGAKKVVANDIDLVAAKVISMNAKLNQVSGLEISTKNLMESNIDDSNVILLGDMFYDRNFAKKIYNWLSSAIFKKTLVLIGDPGRAVFLNELIMQHAIKFLNKYELPEQSRKENNGLTHTSVWSLNLNMKQFHWQTQLP